MGAVVLAATAVVAMGAASPAAATAKTWTVRPGGAVTAKAGKTKLADTTNGNTAVCVSSDMSGSLKPGSGLSGTGIGSITAAAYGCPTVFGAYHVKATDLPWHLNLTSYDPSTGISRGTISKLRITFMTLACSAVINGTGGPADGVVAVTYSNTTGTLRIVPKGGNLHWVHVQGCHTLIANGDAASISASYAVSPAQTITSP
jgi:hypothetical protein